MAARNIFRTAFTMGSCLALLGGCTWLTSWDGSPDQTLAPPPPQATVTQTADATWMKTDKSTTVTHMVPETPQGNRDGMERLAKLEVQVAQMQNDMKTMMPVLNRLVAVQTDTQTMLARLEGGSTATAVTPSATPPATPPYQMMSAPAAASTATAVTPETVAVAPATAAPAAMTPPPAVAPAMAPAVMIQGLRIGEHPGKTRIVLDTNDKLTFTQGVDNATQTLTIDVQGAGWQGMPQSATPKSPLLTSWQAAPDGQGGTRFTMQLRKPAKIVAAQALGPSNGAPSRIMIDLAAL